MSAFFEDTKLQSAAGFVPAMVLAGSTSLGELASQWLTLPGHFGENAGSKVTALFAEGLASADSLDDRTRLCSKH